MSFLVTITVGQSSMHFSPSLLFKELHHFVPLKYYTFSRIFIEIIKYFIKIFDGNSLIISLVKASDRNSFRAIPSQFEICIRAYPKKVYNLVCCKSDEN